jgi:hypothetical protein
MIIASTVYWCLMLSTVLGPGVTAAVAGATVSRCGACDRGQYWRISSLNAPRCAPFDPEKLEYFVYDCRRGWLPSTREAYLASDDPAASTSFFVHGYFPQRWITVTKMVDSSTDGGWLAFDRLSPRDRPFRFVLWVWPGERDDGSRLPENIRIKMGLAELQAWYLAWVVDQMNPDVPVGLISDSLGAPALTGALHVLGGGAVGGQSLERIHPARMPLRAALVAGTMNNDWLVPGRRHGLALSQVDKMLITVNPRDRMLKLYTLFKIGGGVPAVGETGIAGRSRLGPYRERVVHFASSPYVGGRHWWTTYLRSPAVVARLKPFAFPPPRAWVASETEVADGEPSPSAAGSTATTAVDPAAAPEADQPPEQAAGRSQQLAPAG